MADLTENQHLLLSTIVRISASISFLASSSIVYSVVSKVYYRRRIFHRIMLGCAINTMILNVNMVWGPAAVPADTPGFVGSKGNTATCSTQGFLYTMGFVVPSYYASLSILCYFAVKHKFHINRYRWIEPYVHIGVFLWPLAVGSYILSVQGFNPAIVDCYFISIPHGCGDQSSPDNYIPCERGPDNYSSLSRWLVGLPLGIILLLPTAIMSLLWCQIRPSSSLGRGQQQQQQQQRYRYTKRLATSVCYQSLMYLAAIYWTYLFRFIYMGVYFKGGKYVFGLHIVSNIMEAMQGVWIAMAYYFFRSDPLGSSALQPTRTATTFIHSNTKKKSPSKNMSKTRTTRTCTCTDRGDDDDDDDCHFGHQDQDGDDEYIGNCGEKEEVKSTNISVTNNNVQQQQQQQQQQPEEGDGSSPVSSGAFSVVPRKPSFSIFDGFGTNPDPDSPWAQYLQDEGEDDEYQQDCGEYEDTAYMDL